MPYPLPKSGTEDTLGFWCIPVPADDDYRAVVRGAFVNLGKWYEWERDDEKRGAIAAQYMRNLYKPEVFDLLGSCCGDNDRGVGEDLPCGIRYENGRVVICVSKLECDVVIYNDVCED